MRTAALAGGLMRGPLLEQGRKMSVECSEGVGRRLGRRMAAEGAFEDGGETSAEVFARSSCRRGVDTRVARKPADGNGGVGV